jgi:hypothetical protein
LPDVIVFNGEEDKVMGILLEEWFRSKAVFGLGGLVFHYFASWRWGLLSFPCGTSGVGADLSQLLLLLRMNLVISRKAWYLTTWLSSMVDDDVDGDGGG